MNDVSKDTISPQMAEVHQIADGEATEQLQIDGKPLEVADQPVKIEREFIQTDEELSGEPIVM